MKQGFMFLGSGLKCSLENSHKDTGDGEEPEGSGSPEYDKPIQKRLRTKVGVEVVIINKLRRACCAPRTQPSA